MEKLHPWIGIPCHTVAMYHHFQNMNDLPSETPLIKTPIGYFHQKYAIAIEGSGGVPIPLPFLEEKTHLDPLFQRLDGLLLPGGPDIHPDAYNQPIHPRTNRCNAILDAFELFLCRKALHARIPILGICRGMHLINVVLGGTLYQDVPSELPQSGRHIFSSPYRDELVHSIKIAPMSLAASIFGTGHSFHVNSNHHQAVRNLGDGLVVSGWAADEVPEIIEATHYPFLLGLQFHPEELYHTPMGIQLFQAFISHCHSTPSSAR